MKNLAEENKHKQSRKSTIYNASQHKEKAPLGKILLVIGFVLVMLLAIRFLNLILWWNVTRLELTHDHNPLVKARVGDYRFLGLSGNKAARKKLENLVTLQRVRKVTVTSYFDFLHPAVFLIHSRSNKPYVNLGRMSVYPDKGFTALFFHFFHMGYYFFKWINRCSSHFSRKYHRYLSHFGMGSLSIF